jgi:hypothetical protein
MKRDWVTHLHVELPENALSMAEGLTAESDPLDVEDLPNLDGCDTLPLHPDFATRVAPEAALGGNTWDSTVGDDAKEVGGGEGCCRRARS